jgi:hypothetical protein
MRRHANHESPWVGGRLGSALHHVYSAFESSHGAFAMPVAFAYAVKERHDFTQFGPRTGHTCIWHRVASNAVCILHMAERTVIFKGVVALA